MADLFPAGTIADIRREDKIAELERELKWLRRVYARMVAKGTLSREQARRRQLIIEAIIADYRAQA